MTERTTAVSRIADSTITVTVHFIYIARLASGMARLARLVVPGLPRHVTQRGNGRMRTFFDDDDYVLYCDLLAEKSPRGRGRGLGLVPDAQSRAPDPANYGDSALNRLRQLSVPRRDD